MILSKLGVAVLPVMMLHLDILLLVCAALQICVSAQGKSIINTLLLFCIIDNELQFLSLGELASVLQPYDDYAESVSLPVPLPLGNETVNYYTTAYVSLYVNSAWMLM